MRSVWLVACLVLTGCEGACSREAPPAAGRSAPSVVRAAPSTAVRTAPSHAARSTPSSAAPSARTQPAEELTLGFPDTPVGEVQAVVVVPPHPPGARLPVLVALHGRGEAFKGPARGARAWVDDYWLSRAMQALAAPPLDREDFLGFIDDARLKTHNAALETQPFGGVIVVGAYTPDILAGTRPLSAADAYGRFVIEQLLPRVYAKTPAVGTPISTGIDGVSLGGRMALLVGLSHPRSFGAVGALQAAFDLGEVPELAQRAKRAFEQNPKLSLRLLTSHDDFFLAENRAISSAFSRAGVEHALLVVPGPHDYVFNRGPGALEMLLFHDRTLR